MCGFVDILKYERSSILILILNIFMNKLKILDWVAFVLVVVGGLNWALVGVFKFDLVATIFGDMSALSRVVYTLVGLSALYMIAVAGKLARK